MKNNTHTTVKKNIHTNLEDFKAIENVLISLGFSGLDDYSTMIRSKDIDLLTASNYSFSYLLCEGSASDGVTYMSDLKRNLKKCGILYEMVHKRDGNYLKLVEPDNRLSIYLKNKELQKPSVEIPNDFNYLDYIKSLKKQHFILRSYELIMHKLLDISESTKVCIQENATSYIPITHINMCSCKSRIEMGNDCDGFYDVNISIIDKDGNILQNITPEEQTIMCHNKTFKSPINENESFCTLFSTPYLFPVEIEFKIDFDFINKSNLVAVLNYKKIQFAPDSRSYLHSANMKFNFYGIPQKNLHNVVLDNALLDNHTYKVFTSDFFLPHTACIYDIKIKGYQSIVPSFLIGGKVILSDYEYKRDGHCVEMTSFTKDKPLFTQALTCFETKLQDMKGAEISYKTRNMTKSELDSLSGSYKVEYKGPNNLNFTIKYDSGMCEIEVCERS